MTRRLLILVLVSVGVLSTAATSGSRTFSLVGVAEFVGKGTSWTQTLTNTGSDAIKCMRTFAPSGNSFTSVSGPSGTRSEGPGAFSNGSLNVAQNGTAKFTIATAAPLTASNPPRVNISGDCIRDEPASVVVKGLPAEPVPCTCLQLSISMKKKDAYTTAGQIVPAGPKLARIGGLMRWTMTCSKGDGTCTGNFKVQPPKDSDWKLKVYRPVEFVPAKGPFKGQKLFKPGKPFPALAFVCKGPCAETFSFPFFFTADSPNELQPKNRAGKTLAMRFVISCGGKQSVQELNFVFKANGDLDRKKSDLD